MRVAPFCVLVAIVATLTPAAAQAESTARVYAYPLPFHLPWAINNAGQVVSTDEFNRGYITGRNGKGVRRLETFGGPTTPHDINDAGVVVGNSASKAFITDAGGMREGWTASTRRVRT